MTPALRCHGSKHLQVGLNLGIKVSPHWMVINWSCCPIPQEFPPNLSRVTGHDVSRVTCHVSHVTCHMSSVTFFFFLFFGQSGEAYRLRVCYQRGLPRLVSIWTHWFLSFCFQSTISVTKHVKRTTLVNNAIWKCIRYQYCPKQSEVVRVSVVSKFSVVSDCFRIVT